MWRSNHRAQLTAAMARFQADVQGLTETVSRHDIKRLLLTLDPTRVQSATRAREPTSARPRNGRERQNAHTAGDSQSRAQLAPIR